MDPRIYSGASQLPVSPLPELLANNEIPSDLQAAAILDAIQEAKTELARVEAAIAQLTAQRVELDDFIHKHTSVVSGLRCFPNELLCEIFLRCGDWDRYFDPLINASWTVARVCRRWRDVALSCPELWSRFVVVPTVGPRDVSRFLKMQLDRARVAPLFIQMAAHPQDDDIDVQSDDSNVIDVPSDDTDVLADFLQVAPQWEEVEFAYKHQFARFANDGVVYPQLKKIRLIRTLDPVTAQDLLPDHDLAISLPALVHLDWDASFRTLPPQLSLVWPQLRTLVLRSPDLPDALWILSLLSPGTDVSLILGTNNTETDSVETQIRSLDLSNCIEHFSSGLLRKLVAPRLEKLLLYVNCIHPPFPSQDTLAFLNASACSLKHLRVVDSDSRSLIELLESPYAREIVRLEVSEVRELDLFIEALSMNNTLVPRLRTLAIAQDRRIGNWEEVDVLGILVDRRPSLRTFTSAFGGWDFPEKRAGQMGGLDVVILRRTYD